MKKFLIVVGAVVALAAPGHALAAREPLPTPSSPRLCSVEPCGVRAPAAGAGCGAVARTGAISRCDLSARDVEERGRLELDRLIASVE